MPAIVCIDIRAVSEGIHGQWILIAATRPRAVIPKPVNDHLRTLVTMLDDATADHYKAAHDLGVVIAQLDEMAFIEPIKAIERARRKIIGRWAKTHTSA